MWLVPRSPSDLRNLPAGPRSFALCGFPDTWEKDDARRSQVSENGTRGRQLDRGPGAGEDTGRTVARNSSSVPHLLATGQQQRRRRWHSSRAGRTQEGA